MEMNHQHMSKVSLVPLLHGSAVSSAHAFCTLQVFCSTTVVTAVNSAHSVPALGIIKMSKEQEKFRCKGTITFEGTQRLVAVSF